MSSRMGGRTLLSIIVVGMHADIVMLTELAFLGDEPQALCSFATPLAGLL